MKNIKNFNNKLTKSWFLLTNKPRSSYKFLSFLILLAFSVFSLSSQAAYCIEESSLSGSLRLSSDTIESCSTNMILLTKSEYDAINIDTIVATLKDLFSFSVADFALFNSICLVGFIVGHSIGRVNRLLGKT